MSRLGAGPQGGVRHPEIHEPSSAQEDWAVGPRHGKDQCLGVERSWGQGEGAVRPGGRSCWGPQGSMGCPGLQVSGRQGRWMGAGRGDTGEGPKPHPHDSTLGESSREGRDLGVAFQAPPGSCIGEGNGNPLQCSCLENLRDGGAWWAAVSGVAQSRTRLKRLSSSSSSQHVPHPRTLKAGRVSHLF